MTRCENNAIFALLYRPVVVDDDNNKNNTNNKIVITITTIIIVIIVIVIVISRCAVTLRLQLQVVAQLAQELEERTKKRERDYHEHVKKGGSEKFYSKEAFI